MYGNRLIAILFGALALGCLVITAWIIHRSGVMQAATEDGRWALGWVAVLVHLGVAVCGLAMFAARHIVVSIVCGLMMFGAAAYSAWQIATFAATEVISVTKARDAAEKRESALAAAAIEAAKERHKAQAKLAEQHLKWLQTTTRHADGRLERKDSFEAGNKLVKEFGKTEAPPVEQPKVEATPLKTDVLAEWLAARVGLDIATLQASPPLWLALMLLLCEVVFWPLASYFWRQPAAAAVVGVGDPAAPAPLPIAPMPTGPAVAAEPIKQITDQTAAKVHPSRLPQPERIERRPIPGSVQSLIDIAFPLTKPSGALKTKEPPKDAARRFVVWAKAMGLAGSYNPGELYNSYREFADADHREPVGYNQLAAALEKTRGIEKRRPRLADGSFPTVWEITPGKYPRPAPKPPTDAQDTQHNKGGLGRVLNVFPLAGRLAADAGRIADAQRAFARMQKAEWRRRFTGRDRKQCNRFSRARAA